MAVRFAQVDLAKTRAVAVLVFVLLVGGTVAQPPEPTRNGPAKLITTSVGMELALIPAGRFLMGSPVDEKGRFPNEGPQHLAVITRSFYLGTHAVTVGQFRLFATSRNYRTDPEKNPQRGAVFDQR